MSLVTEINRTEIEKNKTKQVATNIDNKLVELGGEQAIDLSDVPSKIQKMVTTQYSKIVKKDINRVLTRGSVDDSRVILDVPLNLNFEPKTLFMSFSTPGNTCLLQGYIELRKGLNFSVLAKGYESWGPHLYVSDLNKNKITFKMQSGTVWDSRISIKAEKVIVIG